MKKVAVLLVGMVLAGSASAQTWQRIGGNGSDIPSGTVFDGSKGYPVSVGLTKISITDTLCEGNYCAYCYPGPFSSSAYPVVEKCFEGTVLNDTFNGQLVACIPNGEMSFSRRRNIISYDSCRKP